MNTSKESLEVHDNEDLINIRSTSSHLHSKYKLNFQKIVFFCLLTEKEMSLTYGMHQSFSRP